MRQTITIDLTTDELEEFKKWLKIKIGGGVQLNDTDIAPILSQIVEQLVDESISEDEDDPARDAAYAYAVEHDLDATWCIYENVNFDDVAYEGQYTFHYDGGWGEANSEVVTSPTWGDLFRTADRLIRCSTNTHHRFIEAINVNQSNKTLTLHTGS